MTSSESIDIFSYVSYRAFLRDYIQSAYLAKGKSYRFLAAQCGINSPNYFQKLINNQKNMSPRMAEKIGSALGFRKIAMEFFVCLVRLDATQDLDKRFALLTELRRLVAKQKKKKIRDEYFHSNWLHQVICSALAHRA